MLKNAIILKSNIIINIYNYIIFLINNNNNYYTYYDTNKSNNPTIKTPTLTKNKLKIQQKLTTVKPMYTSITSHLLCTNNGP